METPAVLFSEDQVKHRVSELGREIAAQYGGQELCVVGLMKNCIVFMADLIRQIPVDLTVHTVRATQGGSTQTEIVYSAEVPYEGRNILLLDDVVDTGVTLSFLVDHIRERRPKSLRVCALIDKAQDRKVDVRPDWAAFALTDRVDHFIVGYGLDYREHYRGLPYIGTISRPAPPTEGGSLALEG